MKIAFLLGSLNRGGTETLMLDVFRNAKSNNLDAIGIYRKSGVCENEFINSGVSMFKLAKSKNTLIYLFQLRNLINKNNIQIIHAQQPIDAMLAYFALFGTGVKILLTLHGFDYNERKTGKIIYTLILKLTDINIYVSAYQREYYIKKYNLNPKRQKVVFNGISFQKFNLSNSNLTIRSTLKIPEQTYLFGTVGNFNLVRDQLTICRFLKLLNHTGFDFHFLFVGKKVESCPDCYNQCLQFCLENNLADKVHFLGVRNDVPELLKSMDAFVYSSRHDTFGIAVVEALAKGLPVFVNDWQVFSEITENGKFATLYKTKDEADLLHQFSLYLQNKNKFEQKAQLAATVVKEKYSIEKHIENLKQVYRLLIK